ncbi:DUF5320 domain-containing protein [Patescibacteria group bacterium]|nr:DUF5320 domain-containing protein [Patescibacteria group bacterium]MBU4452681.1 DUF5320 domain-containing protein [Patescibacteria group bacterium]MCG2687498.1 DUF5320 domain-containing protein [Candidatus Parcubacteria bacterium]
MPRLDGTGPTGQGQKTGRGLGACNGTVRGCPCPRYNFGTPSLEEQERVLKQQLAAVQEEISAQKPQ